jgi:ABC-type spermidine/putrescine transport system permease subunit II
VTLPLSMPGIVSGSLVVFAWTLSAFPTPELLGGGRVKMIANAVKDLALDSFNWPGAAAFAVVALALTLVLMGGLGRLAAGHEAGMIGRAAVIALVAFMTLPTVVVIVVSVNPTAILSFPPTGFSLRWYVNALTYPQFQRAAVNSLIVTAAASLLALPIGTAAALALERGRLRGRHVWATLLLSPLVVPGVAAGLDF